RWLRLHHGDVDAAPPPRRARLDDHRRHLADPARRHRPQAGAAAAMSAGPLQGLRVLELGNLLAAPCAGMVLADLGAEVVKVEGFAGDPARELQTAAFTGSGTSPTFLAFNRGKRSIALDVRTPGGLEVVRRLLARSD